MHLKALPRFGMMNRGETPDMPPLMMLRASSCFAMLFWKSMKWKIIELEIKHPFGIETVKNIDMKADADKPMGFGHGSPALRANPQNSTCNNIFIVV
jgi:hypothetical protein